MIRSAREVVILADGSKFDQRCSLVLCGFDEVTRIITDRTAPEEMCSYIEEKGIEIIRV
jgi:DeoR family ulaG and ulaABCDEF operon transcriptional repressor